MKVFASSHAGPAISKHLNLFIIQTMCPKLFWHYGGMELSNTPFYISETRVLDCQFGVKYYKDKLQKSSRVLVQGSRKKGCAAHITIKKCISYPDFQVNLHDDCTLRTLQVNKMHELKKALTNKQVVTTRTIYYVSLPTEECHSGHPTGKGVAGLSQRVNEKVSAKISQLVAEGITEIYEVRKLLRHYVMSDLCKDKHPDINDRAYFPTNQDIKNQEISSVQSAKVSQEERKKTSFLQIQEQGWI